MQTVGVTGVLEPSDQLEERQFIIRAQSGDQSAFEWLVHRYQDRLYRSAYSLVGNIEDAMDITQEAFIRAHRALYKFDCSRPFFPWIYKIMRNVGLTCLKKRKTTAFAISLDAPREEIPHVEVPDSNSSPRDLQEDEETMSALMAALESLPPEDREIVILRDLQDYPYKEIAVLLDIPIGTVMSRLYYARERLRKKMIRFLE